MTEVVERAMERVRRGREEYKGGAGANTTYPLLEAAISKVDQAERILRQLDKVLDRSASRVKS